MKGKRKNEKHTELGNLYNCSNAYLILSKSRCILNIPPQFKLASQFKLVLQLQLFCCSLLLLIINHKIRVVGLGFELVPSEDIECKCGQLPRHHTSPKSQLHQIYSGLSIGLGRLTQVFDRPHDREKHRTTANNVNKQEHLFPGDPILTERPCLIYHHLCYICYHLKRDHDHQYLLLLILQVGLQERPPSPNQHDQSKQSNSLQETKYVKQHIPAMGRPRPLDEHHGQHEEVNPKNRQHLLVQNSDPGGGQNEVDDGEEEINPRQNEIITVVGPAVLQVVHGRPNVHRHLQLRKAVGEHEGVLIGVGLGVEKVQFGGGGGREAVKGVDFLYGVGSEDAINLGVLDLLEHASRVQRKNPTLDRAERSVAGPERESLVMLSSSWPRWVNPNSSKGIIGRSSDRISENRISAAAREATESRISRRKGGAMVELDLSLPLWSS
ncbi:plant neutral invertase family protein [Striga asiatica]|uniref:Plant neutral invertase family protein n=1 Tax=Striga asiatica TaxID=4170 RepID=A0A5A7Q372_STRAF|nr:plant neutral invertase family protein [Striga asiatica]